jgi:hypothetical protein
MATKHASIDPTLDELVEKYGTDKNLSNYNLVYAQVFKDIKQEIRSVLEIGIGSMISDNSNFSGNKTHYPFYEPGGSLRVWRDYFPNAMIHGVDIGEDCLFEEERIKTFIFSSMDLHQCKQNLFNYKYDVIIDDGDHSAISQLITFKNLAPLLNEGGYYFIEDLGGYQGYEEPDGTWYRPELLGEYKEELYKTAHKYNLTVHITRPLMIH